MRVCKLFIFLSIASLLNISFAGKYTSDYKVLDGDTILDINLFPREFFFVADNKYMVLSDQVDSNWVTTGDPYLSIIENNGVISALKSLSPESLPDTYLNLLQKKYNVYTDNGDVFVASISSLKLMYSMIPHFSKWQEWQLTNVSGADTSDLTSYSKEEIAKQVWTSEGCFLVAEFQTEEGEIPKDRICFAVPISNQVSFFQFDTTRKSENIKQMIRRKVPFIPDYIKTQEEFKKVFHRTKKMWWQAEGAQEDIRVYRSAKSLSYAFLNHVSGNPCGDSFFVFRFSIWEVDQTNLPSLIHLTDETYQVVAVVDIDGDSIPEILIQNYLGVNTLLKKIGNNWNEYASWNIPYFDCPC